MKIIKLFLSILIKIIPSPTNPIMFVLGFGLALTYNGFIFSAIIHLIRGQ